MPLPGCARRRSSSGCAGTRWRTCTRLGPDQIARAHFVSTRYVHKLFAASGCGVAAWIREQRLERALADLRRSSDASIGAIASRWGYRDASSFSRAFRQAYGSSPRALRGRAGDG
jgi:AraC-like DNA-binding protein